MTAACCLVRSNQSIDERDQMKATLETRDLQHRAQRYGIVLDFDQAQTLRRTQLTLHRWAELKCGYGSAYGSWCLIRDDDTGKPYMEVHPHTGKMHRYTVPDRERGALRRIAKVCADIGCHFYHQTDPRGCALYISREPLTSSDYHRGLPI